MHNAAFRHLGMNWSYVAFDVAPPDLGAVMAGLAASGVVGVNVTVPHKTRAARLLRRLDPVARKIGAVNTIVFSDPPRGFNTDGHGLLEALRLDFGFKPRNKTIAIVGCGGAGQAAAVSLALAGARKLILLNRTAARARRLARRIRSLSKKTKITLEAEPCDLLINATSAGLKNTDGLPLTGVALRTLNPRYFFDMVYRPPLTPLMKTLQKQGARTANGLEMLLRQGARSFQLWTDRRAPVDVMRRALKKEIYG